MKFTYTNANNESVSISRTGTFRILDIDGIANVDSSVQTVKAAYQDGQTHVDSFLEMRHITLEVGIFAETEEQIYKHRRTLSRIFNPKLREGTLLCEFPNGKREIGAIPEATVDFPTGSNTAKFQRAIIEMVCPDPYWLSLQAETRPMANWIGGLKFPLSFRGRDLQFAKRGTRITIHNDGDVSSPVEIVFKGTATNPTVKNRTTGEFIRVNRVLKATDKLIMSTKFGDKRVEIEDADGVRTNAFNWLDLESTFFQLVTGDNEIEYTSDSGIEQSTVQIKWRKRYLGI